MQIQKLFSKVGTQKPQGDVETVPSIELQDLRGQVAALNKSLAVIEFSLDGHIIRANDNFLKTIGYSLDEVKGKHHSMFVEKAERNGSEYSQFWNSLRRGEFRQAEYKRIGKLGKEIWIQASYNPILDREGRPFKVIKYATDVTEQKLRNADYLGQIQAISKSQATIEFSLDGMILHANENFLKAMGYALDDIKGKPHSIFVAPADKGSNEYRKFWDDLRTGIFRDGEFKRIGRNSKEVWIQATYNPIFDLNGRPYKIVKYATDVTDRKIRDAEYAGRIQAMDKSQAVIELKLDGTILTANENFLRVMGYTLDEIQGQHHRMFMDPADLSADKYDQFWSKLRNGFSQQSEFKRIGKNGKQVWLQATYNSITDLNGNPWKVVKYATEVTDKVQAEQTLQQAVREVQSAVSAARNNDLTVRTPLDGKSGRIAELCLGVNGLLDTMSGIVATICEAAETLTASSRELAYGNTELSQRTEEQAASLKETTGSLGEFTNTVKQNADSAHRANELAGSASEIATKGGEVVHEVVTTMDSISQASRKIADIIGVIDEISFQTNILALNAAVEAARAGDNGRGFAVVAAEVRNLAQRSTNAAKEIKTLISDSVNKVEIGSKLVESAGNTMIELVAGVQGVREIMADISAASREQQNGIEHINSAVLQMDKITQQNAALVEEAAYASRSMEEQTEALDNLVSTFKISSDHRAGVRSGPTASRSTEHQTGGEPMTRTTAPTLVARKASRAG